jgi:hypothetical protein
MKEKRAPFERYAGESVTTTRRYPATVKVINGIRNLTPDHGSQGRALQVATEILIRRSHPVKLKQNGETTIRMTYKLLPRTIELLDRLCVIYDGEYAKVFAACFEVLKEKV